MKSWSRKRPRGGADSLLRSWTRICAAPACATRDVMSTRDQRRAKAFSPRVQGGHWVEPLASKWRMSREGASVRICLHRFVESTKKALETALKASGTPCVFDFDGTLCFSTLSRNVVWNPNGLFLYEHTQQAKGTVHIVTARSQRNQAQMHANMKDLRVSARSVHMRVTGTTTGPEDAQKSMETFKHMMRQALCSGVGVAVGDHVWDVLDEAGCRDVGQCLSKVYDAASMRKVLQHWLAEGWIITLERGEAVPSIPAQLCVLLPPTGAQTPPRRPTYP